MTVVDEKHRLPAPDWIAALFGPGRVEEASRLGWGFHNETWKVSLADGRRLAVTLLADADAAASIETLTRLVQPRLLAAGLPAPTVVELGPIPRTGVLVTDFVDGTPGAELLGAPGGATLIGSLFGAAWRKLAGIDATGLPAGTTWSVPDRLAIASDMRLRRIGGRLTPAEHGRLSADIAALPDLLAGRRPGFVHGDFVPVNSVIRDRSLAALLDFEFARLGEPLLDAAWFECIVAFHHPAEAVDAWESFVSSSGLDDAEPITRALLRILPLIRLLEILEDDRLSATAADRWIRILRACLARPQ